MTSKEVGTDHFVSIQEQRLRLALEVAQMLCWDWRIDQNEVVYSQDYGQFFGLPPMGTTIPNDDRLLAPVHPDDRAFVIESFEQALESGESVEIEFRGLPDAGKPRWFISHARIEEVETGVPKRMIGVTQEITQKKLNELRELDRGKRFKRLSELSLTVAGEPEVVFTRIASMVSELIDVPVVSVAEIRGEELYFWVITANGNGETLSGSRTCPLMRGPYQSVTRSGEVTILNGANADFFEASVVSPDLTRFYCGVPVICHGGDVVAIMGLFNSAPFRLDEEDLDTVRIIGQLVAIELERAKSEAKRRDVEQTLRENVERYQRAELATNVGLWDWNIITGHDYFAPGWFEILGYNSGELPYHIDTFSHILHPEDREGLWSDVQDHLEHRSRFESEFRLRHKSGRYLWVRSNGQAEWDADGAPLRMCGAITDITEERQAALQLSQSEERLRLSLEAAGQGFFDLDVVSGNAIVSSEYAEMLGHDGSTFLETRDNWLDRLHPDDRQRVINDIGRCLRGASPTYEVEYRQRTQSNDWLWTLSKGKVVARDRDGNPLRMLGTHTNIQNRKKIELALRESESRLREAQKIAKIGSWEFDLHTSTLKWSDQTCAIFEVNPDDFHGTVNEFLALVHPDDRDMVTAAFYKSVTTKSEYEITHRLQMPDGRIKFVQERSFLQSDASNEPIRAIGTVQDVTEAKEAEIELSRREASFRALFEQGPVGMLRAEPDGTITQVNPTFVEMLGYDLVDLKRIGLKGLVLSDDSIWNRGSIGELLNETEASLDFEERFIRANGEIVWGSLTLTAVRNDGKVQEIFGLLQNIHERKLAEASLRESERRFAAFVEHASDGFFLIDDHGVILDVNEQACASVMRSRQELINTKLSSLCVPESSRIQEIITAKLNDGSIWQIDTNHQRKGGRTFPVELRFRPFHSQGRRLAFCLAHDTTERQSLHATLRWKDLIVQNMFAGAAVVREANGVVLYANTRYAEMFNGDCDDAVGSVSDLLSSRVTSLSSRYPTTVADMLALRDSWKGELQHENRNGDIFWTRANLVKFRHPEHGLVCIAVLEDITDAKQAADSVLEMQGSLARSNRMQTLGEIASGFAHELSQPLAAIHLNASSVRTLAERSDIVDLGFCARKIEEQSFRAGEIIRRLRSLSRSSTSRKELADINKIVKDVLRIMEDSLVQHDLVVRMDLAPKVHHTRVDIVQIQQILVNLIQNAIDALFGSEIEDRTIRIRTKMAGDRLSFEVVDSGPGIDPSIAGKLFFPFQTMKPTGMGLGLSICRSIVEAHAGTIEATRTPGGGATFTVTLPIVS